MLILRGDHFDVSGMTVGMSYVLGPPQTLANYSDTIQRSSMNFGVWVVLVGAPPPLSVFFFEGSASVLQTLARTHEEVCKGSLDMNVCV